MKATAETGAVKVAVAAVRTAAGGGTGGGGSGGSGYSSGGGGSGGGGGYSVNGTAVVDAIRRMTSVIKLNWVE